MRNIARLLIFPLVFIFCSMNSSREGNQNGCSSSSLNANDNSLVKKTHAELWYKTGGHFEQGKYVGGGNFIQFDSLWVPAGCTDHSYFMKYEGPGWESDKIGYRIYLDWRNAIDIFGKKVDTMVLSEVGQDGYESYHVMGPWGMDILKVGESLGIGTLAFWDGSAAQRVAKTDSVFCRIKEDGEERSQIQIDYYGWKIDDKSVNLRTELSIEAHSRATKYSVHLGSGLKNLCTGLVKLDETVVIQSSGKGKWSYYATWGKQSLADDSLGMAILYKTSEKSKITEDQHSHVVVLKPENQNLEYYFLAAWQQELNSIKTKMEFESYLANEINRLDKNE
jgi:hypothetical protein